MKRGNLLQITGITNRILGYIFDICVYKIQGSKIQLIDQNYLEVKVGKEAYNIIDIESAQDTQTIIEEIKKIREEFWKDVKIPGEMNNLNPELEKAGRVPDFLDIGELMARDALDRNESCGGHFREEFQSPGGEALRNDDKFSYVSCWQYAGEGNDPELVIEPLDYEFIVRQQRNYKA